VLGRRYIVALTKFLQYFKYIIFEFTPLHHSPLSSPHPIPGIVSTCLIFPFTHACTQYLSHIHPTTPYPHFVPSPITSSLRKNLFLSLILQLYKRKKGHSCLFKIAKQGVFLWHFQVYMCPNSNCFIPSIFLLSALVHFLLWFQ
jgi:hypothetical protein